MRILWIVNIIFPYPAKQLKINSSCFGGWLKGLASSIRENEEISLAIATVYDGEKLLKFDDGKIKYYLVPSKNNEKYNIKLEKYWKDVNDDFLPNIVHIHGTEYTHGLSFLKACPNIKSIISIQGLVSKCANVYYAGLTTTNILKNITLRDIIKMDNIFQQRQKFKKKGKYEIEAIRKANAIIGRTTWDYANCKSINKDLKYYACNEIIREEFYNTKKWDRKNIEKNSIYLSQGSYPIKGLHKLLEAIGQLKTEGISDIKLYISGANIIKENSLKDKIKISGYGKYIRKLIKKLNLKDNVHFVGNLTVEEVIKLLLKSNLVVVPSIIENESNSLSEASLLGVPVVCSYVGGIVDRVINEENGLTYPFTEDSMLAFNIKKILEDEELADKISKNEIKKYEDILNRENNLKTMLQIYKDVIGEE